MDRLQRYAVVDGVKWRQLRERHLTPTRAVEALQLDPSVSEVPTRNQAKYQLQKLDQEQMPTSDQIQQVLLKYSDFIVNFTVASQFGDGTLFIILSNPTLLSTLEESLFVLFDGTFSISNTSQSQVYVIGTLVSGHYISCCYIYMGKRTTKVYEEVFATLVNAMPLWTPVNGLIDHELAAIRGIQKHLTMLNLFSCYFHLKSSIRDWLASSAREYSSSAEKKRLSATLLMMFDRVATADTTEAFDLALRVLHGECESAGAIGVEFLKYLSDTWGIHGESSRFPRTMWAHIYRPQWMRESFRTSNVLERAHRGMKHSLDRKLGLVGTVGFLCDQLKLGEAKVEKINNGTSSGSIGFISHQ